MAVKKRQQHETQQHKKTFGRAQGWIILESWFMVCALCGFDPGSFTFRGFFKAF